MPAKPKPPQSKEPLPTPSHLSTEQITDVVLAAHRAMPDAFASIWTPEAALEAVGHLCSRLDAGEVLVVEDIHSEWMAAHIADGWTWGPDYNQDKKEDPLLMSWSSLPLNIRYGDQLFLGLVLALAFEWETPEGTRATRRKV